MRLDDQIILLINLYKKCEALCKKEELVAPKTIITIFKSEADQLVSAQKMSRKAVDVVLGIYGETTTISTGSYFSERRYGGC